jgi:hypothetical protein
MIDEHLERPCDACGSLLVVAIGNALSVTSFSVFIVVIN